MTMLIKSLGNILNCTVKPRHCAHLSNYVQGQTPKRRVREYFYYIDHQGMLFLDDARMKNFTSCYKEIKFLNFFFKHLKINKTERYPEFPFISLCGIERNFVRCDDVPIVYTHLVEKETNNRPTTYICYGNAGETMKVEFDPSKISMEPNSGRVYYPASQETGGVGLVRSQLAIQLSTQFIFGEGDDGSPTHINWKGEDIKLTQECLEVIENIHHLRKYSLGLNT